MKYAACRRDDCISCCLGSDSCEVGSARVGQWILVLDYSSCLRRKFDWGEPCLTGRSNNECLRADRKGRVSPHMQEQDPRRDVSGCNRKNQKNVALEPEKEP